MAIDVTTFYDERSGTATHILICSSTLTCAVIDPVFDLDPKSGRTSRAPVDAVATFIRGKGLTLDWILETHLHHDHVSGAFELREALGGRIALSKRIRDVANVVRDVYAIQAPSIAPVFDQLLEDVDLLPLGDEEIEVWETPGHTIDHLSFRVANTIFVGDTLFMPDSGTARCDFHRGDARQIFSSIQRILREPDDVRLFLCHDYGADGSRPPAWETTVGAQRRSNIHVGGSKSEADFIALRTKRDTTLDMPALLLQALPLNIDGGRLPPAEENGRVFLKIPLDVPGDAL